MCFLGIARNTFQANRLSVVTETIRAKFCLSPRYHLPYLIYATRTVNRQPWTMETHPLLCQPSAATAAATAVARTDAIRRALGDGGGGGSQRRGGGQRHDVVGGDDGGGGGRHHVVAQLDDASGGQRHHLSSRKRRRRRDDPAMLVRVDRRTVLRRPRGLTVFDARHGHFKSGLGHNFH